MASFPPIPALPAFPFSLPFNFTIDLSHVLRLPDPAEDFCACCTNKFLDCLVLEEVGRQGCDWVIIVNRKVYYIKWRDVLPRPPWTRAVWDIFRLVPDVCGCPSAPISLGWQWCWADVIKTIRYDVFLHWQNGDISGSGQTVVAIGTNVFQEASVGIPQIGPTVYLDASDASTITSSGGLVEEWGDKSTHENNAIQTVMGNRPTLAPASLNGLDTIRFDASASQFMNVQLRRRGDWHLFVVGRFFTNVANTRGTFFGAMGFDGTFGGIEGKIYQNNTVRPQGTPFTFVNPSEVAMLGTTLSPGIFGILEYRETVSTTGEVSIGVNAFDQSVFTGSTSDDYWDPTRQTFSQPIPLQASVGRSNWGINPARSFDYLDGNIGQILLYPGVLAEGQRTQVLNVLRQKWGLGAPLPLPPNP